MAIPKTGLQNYNGFMKLNGLHLHACAGVPDDALAGHPKGCLVVDITNGALYINTGTDSSTTYNNVQAIAASEITLAEGSILVGNSSGVATALNAKTTTQILVGNGTTITSVAISGDATMSNAGALTVTDVTVGSDAAGDMLYKSSATALTRLPKGTSAQVLFMNAGATAPEWVTLNGDATVTAGGNFSTTKVAGAPKRIQATPTAKTTSATLTASEILAGIVTVNQGGAATSSLTLPTATDLETALTGEANDDAFDFSLINISTVAAEDADILTNTGWTLVGSMAVQSNDAITSKSAGLFRARKVGAATWTLYRVS